MTRKTIKNPKSEIRNPKFAAERRGSAIILAIVLTTLLALLGVLFLFSSRVDSVATSAVSDNENLKLAVDSVVTQISKVLTQDVPGVEPNGTYYDYPDPCNPWLACLEPYQSGIDYFWRQVSNIYGPFVQNIQAQIVPEYQPNIAPNIPADADGDGVSDSIWTLVPDISSSKGKHIYAAVRIVDNGGMLNVNTAYKFDPNTSVGTSQLDINLMTLAALDHTHTPDEAQNRLLSYRCGSDNANFYEPNVIWQYGLPDGAYTPFDISDELNLRYRYILNRSNVTRTVSRIETLWTNAFDGPPYVPRNTDTAGSNWAWVVNNSYPSLCPDANVYDNRHIATIYNMDRIINPSGSKMFNINTVPSVPDINTVRDKLREALDPNIYDANYIAVNLVDYLDADSNVTYFVDPYTSQHYWGFETPCIYISEIAYNFYQPATPEDANTYRSYAIELFKPYWEDDEPNGWYIETQDLDSDGNPFPPNITPVVWTGSRRFHVLANINTSAIIPIEINEPSETNIPEPNVPQFTPDINFGPGTTIVLRRDVKGSAVRMIVDTFAVPPAEGIGSWMEPNKSNSEYKSLERDIASKHKCIRRIVNPDITTPTLGHMNHIFNSGGDMIQAHPANKPFTNIGEIGQLFRTNAYGGSIGPSSTEASVRLDLAEPNLQNLFNYITVIDPYPTYTFDQNETRIKGRININTAPWPVLAQLPWLSYHTQSNYNLARSIVDRRDARGAFKNIGELMTDANSDINSMGHYIGKGGTVPEALLTPKDDTGDIFLERDLIFNRISNLITVRSDVFTAYILVRIGADGPQKRVIAILDRSGITPTAGGYTGKVKVIAVQPVPDPR